MSRSDPERAAAALSEILPLPGGPPRGAFLPRSVGLDSRPHTDRALLSTAARCPGPEGNGNKPSGGGGAFCT